jgi:1-deoxy-D-xylulose-5-phosphate synthase
MATQGYIPVVAIYSTFLQRAFDQIVHDCALQNLHVVFVMDRGGLVGADGATHHGALDLSFLRCVQGMVVMAPKDEQELRDMLFTAIERKGGPIALRYPRGAALGVPVRDGFSPIEIGKGETLRKGKDVALLAVGAMVEQAQKAADILTARGIDAEVVNMRFVKPIDRALLSELSSRIKVMVTLEDNVVQGGFGAGVLEAFSELGVTDVHVRLHGLPDEFIVKLDAAGVAEITENFLASCSEKITREH